MATIEVLHGARAMAALMRAYQDTEQTFNLKVVATAAVEDGSHRLLFTIEKTMVALTIGELDWLSEMLIEHSGGLEEAQRLGRLLRTVLEDAPGPHQELH